MLIDISKSNHMKLPKVDDFCSLKMAISYGLTMLQGHYGVLDIYHPTKSHPPPPQLRYVLLLLSSSFHS